MEDYALLVGSLALLLLLALVMFLTRRINWFAPARVALSNAPSSPDRS